MKCLGNHISELEGVPVRVLLAKPSIHQSMWHGESERNVRALFREARQVAEASEGYTFLVFDDMDHLGARNGFDSIDSRILPTFLQEIDALLSVDRLLLVGATNRPDLVDDALLRQERFGSRVYHIPRPGTRQATCEILECYLTEDLPYRQNGNGRKSPAASVIGDALSALYAPNGEFSTLAKLHFRDGSTKPVTPAMVMSGALIKSATGWSQAPKLPAQRERGPGRDRVGGSPGLIRSRALECRRKVEAGAVPAPSRSSVRLGCGQGRGLSPRERSQKVRVRKKPG